MSFLRVKKIKGKEYAYLVENNWTAKGPRQEVKKYLGRIHCFEGKSSYANTNFNGAKEELLKQMVFFELGKVRNKIQKEKIEFDEKNWAFLKGRKNCVLGLNKGFMCEFTLKRILDFKKSGDLEVDSVKLAKFFIEAGFEVPKEAFIAYFEEL